MMGIVGKLPQNPEKRAKKLRERLQGLAREIEITRSPMNSEAAKELMHFDIETAEQAAETISVLGTEVTRLRLGIQHFYSGRMTERQLLDMTKNWNNE